MSLCYESVDEFQSVLRGLPIDCVAPVAVGVVFLKGSKTEAGGVPLLHHF